MVVKRLKATTMSHMAARHLLPVLRWSISVCVSVLFANKGAIFGIVVPPFTLEVIYVRVRVEPHHGVVRAGMLRRILGLV